MSTQIPRLYFVAQQEGSTITYVAKGSILASAEEKLVALIKDASKYLVGITDGKEGYLYMYKVRQETPLLMSASSITEVYPKIYDPTLDLRATESKLEEYLAGLDTKGLVALFEHDLFNNYDFHECVVLVIYRMCMIPFHAQSIHDNGSSFSV